MQQKQYVCTVCGYNMIDSYPDNCPFCGADKTNFITAQECSSKFNVKQFPVNDKVIRLNSIPDLGYEHAAYWIKTGDKNIWIDCPSCFDKSLPAPDSITFTHHHFLGASNLYRDYFNCQVHINKADSNHKICNGFTFDTTFTEDFTDNGLKAFHINGHTPGFTFYIFDSTLFVCDYIYYRNGQLAYNPFGPPQATSEGGLKMLNILKDYQIHTVCGVDYVTNFTDWAMFFDH